MTPHSSDALARLRAADPAQHTVPDDSERARLWQLIAATPGEDAPGGGAVLATSGGGILRRAAPGRAGRARLPQLRLAIPTMLVLAAVALAASGVMRAGAPVEPARGVSRSARGGPVTGSVRLLPLTAPDPGGGPPWGATSITYKLNGQARARDDGPWTRVDPPGSG